MRGTRRLGALLLLCCLWLWAPLAARAEADFPEPPGLQAAVAFWSRVYLEVSTDGGLLHDDTYLDVVYEVIHFDGAQGRERERITDAVRERWQDALRQLARGAGPRSDAEARVLRELTAALGREPRSDDLRAAAERMRFQLGQQDKFREGLVRSGAYEIAMRQVFRQAGYPEDLAFLPHVESSFNVRAYSKYGAAGAWQFMRSTGRSYMRIGYEIDERLDPMISTRAAARLLGDNYRALRSWPLALTAYNHGRAGMMRAKNRHGDDMVEIIRNYKSPSFGFASRNFYAQFLAARRIVRSYESYFGPVKREPPHNAEEIELPFYLEVADLRALGVSEEVIRDYNPALRNPVFTAGKRIPKGYVLRLPAGTTGGTPAQTWLAAVPRENRHSEQQQPRYYEVRRGDTLSAIARRSGVTVARLASVNGLRSRQRIYPGAVLQLPDNGRRREPPTPPQPAPERGSALVANAGAAETVPAPLPQPPRPKTRVPELVAGDPRGATLPAPSAPRERAVMTAASSTPPPEEPLAETAAMATAAAPVATASARAPSAPGGTAPGQASPATAPSAEPVPPAPADEPATAAEVAAASAAPTPVASLSEDSPWRRIRGNTIVVDADETLGHYAEWLEVSTARLRRLNRLRPGASLRMGQRIKLDFTRVRADSFLQRRIEYHKGIAEDFFGSFEVVSVKDHRVRPGDSIWQLSTRTYGVPTWLIHRYNPEADLTRLAPGSKLVIPVVQELQS